MHGLVWDKGCKKDSIERVAGHVRNDTPNFFCQSLVAMVMQGVGRVARIDRIGDSGQPQRLSLTPSWWCRPVMLWINDLSIGRFFRFSAMRIPVVWQILQTEVWIF